MPTRKRIQTSQPSEVSGGDIIVVESGEVDILHEEQLGLTDDPIIVDLEVPDSVDVADEMADASLCLEDPLDVADMMSEVTGTITPDESLTFDMAPIITDLTVPEPLIFVNEPPSLNPTVAEFYVNRGRLADMVTSVGEVTKFDGVGRGTILVTSASANRRQVRQDDANSTFVWSPGSFTTGTNNGIRASNNALSPNARWAIASWRLDTVKGVHWGRAEYAGYSTGAIQGDVLNQDLLATPVFSVAGAMTGSLGTANTDPTTAWTWNNSATLRGLLAANSFPGTVTERVDGTAGVAHPINGPQVTTLWVRDPFDIKADFGRALHMGMFQETNVLQALELRAFNHFFANLQFQIE